MDDLGSRPTRRGDPVNHILVAILQAVSHDDPWHTTIRAAGVRTLEDFMEMSKEDWLNVRPRPPQVVANQFMLVKSWYIETGLSIWDLTQEIYTEWRRECARRPAESTETTSNATPMKGSRVGVFSPQDEVRKHIKRDVNAYKAFKDKKNWNQWYRSLTATAQAQGCIDVLDEKYKPRGIGDQATFEAAQDFMFAVFTATLQEPSASVILRKYSNKKDPKTYGDAQSLHADLVEKFSDGVVAETERTKLENKLVTLRLDSSWNKPICAFLTHVQHIIQDLRELRPEEDESSYQAMPPDWITWLL